ncbi:ATP-dependent endonuclease [Bacteroides sp. 214]|uniref:AAA family ATPase n=1 Tax=Bacteroides sp. 214 TaxID=2302935 RepID=UPI0013D320A9|nr:AAA family ATPase [Bacteroides sp. 214]NDW11913.1 ATP-dependent endonuclease [Bacteroides sp. 214]
MKILSIKLSNLASIEGTYKIDFTAEPLASAGIFAISGATGAGKSTILDALCLALYDKTPRFMIAGDGLKLKDGAGSEVSQNDVRNILRRGTGEGYAEVIFEAVDGLRYQACWSIRRARGKATGSLQQQTVQVKNLDEDKELQGTKMEVLKQLTTLVGLNYEQFTRTVLLAQNDFATFLKSKESAKAELLEKLTGTEIYSRISQAIYNQSKEAEQAYLQLKSQIALIDLLDEEEYTLLKEKQTQQVAQRDALNKQLVLLNEKQKVVLTLHTQQQLLTEKRAVEEQEKQNFTAIEEEQKNLLLEYEQFKSKCEALQPDLRKARELDTRIVAKQTEWTQAEKSFKEVVAQKVTAEKVLNNKELQLVHELKTLSVPNTISFEEQIKHAISLLGDKEKEIVNLQQTHEQALVTLNAFNIASVTEEQSLLVKQQQQLQQNKQRTVNWLRIAQELQGINKELQEQTLHIEKLNVSHIESGIVLKSKTEQLERTKLLYEQARLAIGRDVKALRATLKPEEICPVCGSKEHPYAAGHEVADTIYRTIEKEFTQITEEYQQVNNTYVALERDMRNATQQKENLIAKVKSLQAELDAVRPASEEESVLLYFDQKLSKLETQLDALTAIQQTYHRQLEVWRQQDSTLNSLRTTYNTYKESINTCRLCMQELLAAKEKLQLIVSNEIMEKSRFSQLTDELTSLQKERLALLNGMSADIAEANVARRDAELLKLVDDMRVKVDMQKNKLATLNGEINQLLLRVEELKREKEQVASPEELPELIAQQQLLLKEAENALSVLNASVMQQETNRLKLKEVEKELTTKQSIANEWGKLNELIGSADGKKFKIIAQSYTLNLLLIHANKHLSYLSKRYKLQQIPDTLGLQVVDCDMGNEVRTVYSLSGGESFLISLALALGLSSLSSKNLKVESLFIDEGFGSLDADTLRTAMEALEQLQMQGRKIGVISHVQEMSERIPVQIRVDKLPNGRSHIEVIS